MIFLLISAASLAAQVTDKQLLEPPGSNWLHYNGSYDGRRHSQLTQINTTNISSLTTKWIFHMPGAGRLQTVPIVAGGVMYVTQPNEIYALDARSGRLIWDYHHIPALDRGPNRGVAVYGDKVYFTTPDAHLLAFDAASGNLLWDVEIADPSIGYCSPAAPLVVKGKVLVGVAFGDRGLLGFVDAFDAITGKHAWRWNAIPRAGEPGVETWAGESWKTAGGATWMTGSYDPELNLLYWGIGNPAPDFNGDVRKGDNLYTESMVAIDADTGKLKWYFQFTPHDVMDWDGAETPVLVDVPYEGKMRKLVVTADRNGFYYVLDRATGEYLHGVQFAQLLNWATGLTPEGKPIRVKEIEPTLTGTKVCPSSIGATNWMSPTFDPATNLFYFVALESCGMASKNTEKFRPGGFQYRATGDVLLVDETWRVYVRALEVTTGKQVWEQERIGSTGLGGGLMSTAGGVIFSGELSGQFVALDAKTGKILWHFNTGQRIDAQPITYAINGKEYAAIATASDIISFGLFESEVKTPGVEKVAGDFGFTEGPVWKDGALIFSDIPNSKILKLTAPDQTEVYRTATNAANGNSMDTQGRLYTCERDTHRVVRTEKDGSLTVIASEWEGKRLNSPNDVVVRKDGQVYFSDPLSAALKDIQQLDFNGVYHVTPQGKISLVTKMTRPNGVAISPDGRTLYVSDTQERKILAFDLDAEGNSTKERVLISDMDGGPDGLRISASGNLYIAARGIAVYTPSGRFIRMIEFPETPANCAFGDADLRTLYVTARTSIYKVRISDEGSLQY
jgi:alcohol dehydrogenase (cytochrome c)